MTGQRLQFPAECRLCGQVMRAGEIALGVSGGKGFIHSECPGPERKSEPAPTYKGLRDAEPDFEYRKCSHCGELWSFRAGTPIPPVCPSGHGDQRCGGVWVTALNEGWRIEG